MSAPNTTTTSGSKAATALSTVLRSNPASKLPHGRPDTPIIELSSQMPPIDAAKTLWAHNILGAPVWDDDGQKYVGFFDMRDILSSVVAAAKAEKEMKEGDEAEADHFSFQEKMVKALEKLKVDDGSSADAAVAKEELVNVTPSDLTVSYLAARNPFTSVSDDCTLAQVCQALVEKHCHRVPIVDTATGKCTAIISQSALVKFLAKQCPRDDLTETLAEAGLPYKKDVASIVDTADASEAFELLDAKRMSGIAVVDEDGMLVGNTSARDIKFAALDEGRTAMDTDILSYLASVRQATPQKKERYPSCHVHEDSTIGHVINLLAKTGYHRVFVVDKDIKPVGVISVADIVKFAIS
mmetsp:Transcript_15507/g.33739  ORF Transcript_15507/g.33739 Transcript_15507/m.33739 type:complete len:354 (+) Transcript_15507:276-1337(+)